MLNNCNFTGRLCETPELKHTQSDNAVTSFSIAVQRDFAQQGQEKETDFIPCVAWKARAEHICKYYSKGQMICVTGRMQTRRYQDKDGNKRTAFELLIENSYFGESKKSDPADDVMSSAKAAGAEINFVNSENDFSVVPGDDDLPF